MEERSIVCGDAYAFQGDERDVMFLSMVSDNESVGKSSLTKKEFKQRFNVAVSRAKDQYWLFHSADINAFRNKECLRYRLLSYSYSTKSNSSEQSWGREYVETIRVRLHTRRHGEDPPDPFESRRE